jgi:hypothetical protein
MGDLPDVLYQQGLSCVQTKEFAIACNKGFELFNKLRSAMSIKIETLKGAAQQTGS